MLRLVLQMAASGQFLVCMMVSEESTKFLGRPFTGTRLTMRASSNTLEKNIRDSIVFVKPDNDNVGSSVAQKCDACQVKASCSGILMDCSGGPRFREVPAHHRTEHGRHHRLPRRREKIQSKEHEV